MFIHGASPSVSSQFITKVSSISTWKFVRVSSVMLFSIIASFHVVVEALSVTDSFVEASGLPKCMNSNTLASQHTLQQQSFLKLADKGVHFDKDTITLLGRDITGVSLSKDDGFFGTGWNHISFTGALWSLAGVIGVVSVINYMWKGKKSSAGGQELVRLFKNKSDEVFSKNNNTMLNNRFTESDKSQAQSEALQEMIANKEVKTNIKGTVTNYNKSFQQGIGKETKNIYGDLSSEEHKLAKNKRKSDQQLDASYNLYKEELKKHVRKELLKQDSQFAKFRGEVEPEFKL